MKTRLMFLFVLTAVLGFSGLLTQTIFAGSALVFKDTECKLLGNSETTIKVTEGDRTIGNCSKRSKTLVCSYKTLDGKSLGNAQEYEILLDNKGFTIAQSRSGNIKVVLDTQSHRYLYGMVYFSLEKGAMITKNCVGTLQEK